MCSHPSIVIHLMEQKEEERGLRDRREGVGKRRWKGKGRKETEVEEWCGKKRDEGTLSRQRKKGKRRE